MPRKKKEEMLEIAQEIINADNSEKNYNEWLKYRHLLCFAAAAG